MADKNFIVKNGLTVNTAAVVNSTGIYYNGVQIANSTSANSANNALRLGGTLAASYQLTGASLNSNIASYLPTYPGNINTVATVNATTFSIGSSWTANSTKVVFGSTVGLEANGSIGSANQALFSNGTTVYWANVTGGAGYYKGNQGAAGSASNANNIFRVNANTISNNITISAGENASATGPLDVATGFTLTIDSGGTAVIL